MNGERYSELAPATRNYTDNMALVNQKRRFVEAGICIPGEVAELKIALLTGNAGKKELVLECGDVLWYWQELVEVMAEYRNKTIKAMQQDITNLQAEIEDYATYGTVLDVALDGMATSAGMIANVIKKMALYGRELEVTELMVWMGHFQAYLMMYLKQFEKQHGVSPETVMLLNIEKLYERRNVEIPEDVKAELETLKAIH